MPSTLRTLQKCAFNTSVPTSPSLESSNRPDADCHATRTSIDTSSSGSQSESPSTVYINPHRAKRIWPPDVSKLSRKQQFRLERKYRRRAKLKWARPTWTKWTKLVQWAAISWVMFPTHPPFISQPFVRRWLTEIFLRLAIDPRLCPSILEGPPFNCSPAFIPEGANQACPKGR
ncbi:hypothetical protein I7I51_05390 [Histoplasma capsulatum]|uniref:Uncharacterized protein n=1 Tax=Ajellomyces capsulatus TaxID=5037 RepID=A0A8A1M5J8_AJECA|nr:hypothetical protein I7I51_05390 [Histoplasma capsulatum]